MAIRLRFNDVLSQFDLFTEVVTQRSENGTGVWLSGLDVLAADALGWTTCREPRTTTRRRWSATWRGARARRSAGPGPGCPAGGPTRSAIIRVPRERMVGHGIASSLVHEVGHQGAALLGLVESLRPELRPRRSAAGRPARPWRELGGTVSECVADLLVGRPSSGSPSTLGLLAVVSLPRFFVFRPPGDDPHPMPYLRVLLSAAIGDALYPHPQWAAVADTWQALLSRSTACRPSAAGSRRGGRGRPSPDGGRMASHRPPALRGRRARPTSCRWPNGVPSGCSACTRVGPGDLGVLARQPPTLVFAVVGQARAAGRITPTQESRLLSDVLSAWAVRSSLDVLEPRPSALPRRLLRKDLDTWPSRSRKTPSATTTDRPADPAHDAVEFDGIRRSSIVADDRRQQRPVRDPGPAATARTSWSGRQASDQRPTERRRASTSSTLEPSSTRSRSRVPTRRRRPTRVGPRPFRLHSRCRRRRPSKPPTTDAHAVGSAVGRAPDTPMRVYGDPHLRRSERAVRDSNLTATRSARPTRSSGPTGRGARSDDVVTAHRELRPAR